MHGQIGLLSPWKASSHSTVLPSFFVLLCAVFSCLYATGCEAYIRLLRQMDMGSLTCAQMWVRAEHRKADLRYKQVCTRVYSEGTFSAKGRRMIDGGHGGVGE